MFTSLTAKPRFPHSQICRCAQLFCFGNGDILHNKIITVSDYLRLAWMCKTCSRTFQHGLREARNNMLRSSHPGRVCVAATSMAHAIFSGRCTAIKKIYCFDQSLCSRYKKKPRIVIALRDMNHVNQWPSYMLSNYFIVSILAKLSAASLRTRNQSNTIA